MMENHRIVIHVRDLDGHQRHEFASAKRYSADAADAILANLLDVEDGEVIEVREVRED
jgi:hypothetical protein